MASALMAFVQGLTAEQPSEEQGTEPERTETAKDDDLFEDSGPEEEAEPKTLLAVAQQQQTQQADSTRKTLEKLAAQVDREDEQQRDAVVHSTLNAVANEVRDERQQETREAVAAALKEAAAEQYADEFEAEEDAGRVLAAAASLVQQQQSRDEYEADDDDHVKPKAAASRMKKPKPKPKPTSKSAPRTMRDQLSAFQCRQLTLTQRRLLLASLADDGASGTSKRQPRAVNMEALAELAKPRDRRPTTRAEFAKLEDTRHCRFRPRLHAGGGSRESPPGRSDDEDAGGGGGGSGRAEGFLRRMEAAERARVEGLRRTREEKLYLSRVDKKECPACGSAQSYAELSQKRKKCPNCGVAYRSRIAWSAVADEFLARLETYVAGRERARSAPPAADPKQQLRPTWGQVRDEFLGRVQLDEEHRALSKAAVWREVAEQWTFRPQISRRAQQLELGTFDERLRRDLAARRQRREQYDRLRLALDRGADAAAPGPAQPRAKSAASAPTAPFMERMRLDLQRRRDREQQSEQQQKQAQRLRLPRAC